MRNQKKRIAFVLTSFVVGGVEKSFLDLLDCIDQEHYEVTVFLPDDKGDWTFKLSEKCNVRYLKMENFKTVFFRQIKQYNFFGALRSLYFRTLSRAFFRIWYRKSSEFFVRSMIQIKEKYDCVVAYQIINDECVLGSLYRIKASKKIVWSHLDLNKTEKLYEHWYNKFDKIFCVSKFSQNAVIQCFPSLKNKTEIFYNVINPLRIEKMAEEEKDIQFDNNCVNIVTVARLAKVKGQTMIPRTAHLLLESGYNIKWYLIGDGELRQEIIKKISEEHVENHVILLGNKNNPYPYIKDCDIYVQTSFVEGWGLTVSEAKVLHKPIVTTEAGVMSEQIENNINGIIVYEPTPTALVKEILKLIEKPELRLKFLEKLQEEDVCHYGEVNKLYKMVES